MKATIPENSLRFCTYTGLGYAWLLNDRVNCRYLDETEKILQEALTQKQNLERGMAEKDAEVTSSIAPLVALSITFSAPDI